MSSGMIAAGLGLAAFGYGARILLRNARHAKAAQEAIKQTLDSQVQFMDIEDPHSVGSSSDSTYYSFSTVWPHKTTELVWA